MLASVSAESNKGGKAPLTFWFPSWNLISGNILIAVYSERHVIFNPVWSVAMSHTYTIAWSILRTIVPVKKVAVLCKDSKTLVDLV